MQPAIPYRVIGRLGRCDVGTVWWAADTDESPVSVAVLDPGPAAEPQWRDAFAAAASAPPPTADGRRTSYVGADFTTGIPWVAFRGEEEPGAERVFVALGRTYRPDVPPDRTYGEDPHRTADLPVSVPPISAAPISAGPVPAAPVSGSPGSPAPGQPAYDPFASPGRRIIPSPPKQRLPKALWIGLAAVLVLGLAAGGVLYATSRDGGTPKADPSRTAGSTVSIPPSTPVRPGLEPPRPGDWPTRWPTFGRADSARPLNLEGLGFTLTVPGAWQCVSADEGAGLARYNCGATLPSGEEIGGEVTVHECPRGCDDARRTELRAAEEAWGAQWRFAGAHATIAETLKLEGADRYGLVLLGYWRSNPDEAIDRQVVLRMTAPPTWLDDIRKVANAVRDTAGF